MNTRQMFYDLEMFIISFGIATFTLGYTYFLLTIALYLFLRNQNIKFNNSIILWFFVVLLSGSFFAFYTVVIDKYNVKYDTDILLRVRFFWIRIIFAFAILTYACSLKYEQLLKFVYYISIPLTITGLFQFFSSPTERVMMLTSEPSAAGMYYIFLLPLLLIYYRINKKARFWIILFIITGIFIRSKAQILVIPFYILYFIFKTKNKKLKRIIISVITVVILISPFLLSVNEVNDILHFYETFKDLGIKGLREENHIFSSFTTRFSSFLTAIQLFYENPFGIGFGVFHPEYILRMSSPDFIQSYMNGVEISATLKGVMYGTPKSIFFEYLVCSGLFFLLPLIYYVWKFHKQEKSELIKASLYGLLIVSLMVELAPFITFNIILLTIFNKKKNELQMSL